MELENKYQKLVNYLQSLERVAVAFSGGVDSAFLLWTAVDVLGKDRVIAVTASACSFPERERREAEAFCRQHDIQQIVFPFHELEVEGFCQNPPNRCYLCKRELLKNMLAIASRYNMKEVAEGSNTDDEGDYRPGMQAVRELGIKSPLRYAGLGKQEIRELSRKQGLSTWNKQSAACLSSRFVYGEIISAERIAMVDRAEQFLLDKGFHQVRVRLHGQQGKNIARIEILPEEFSGLIEQKMRREIYHMFQEIGFAYITLDLDGYRTGSMNEVLEKQETRDDESIYKD